MPPGARLSLRHLLRFTTLHADEAAQARDRRPARRKDCIRQSRSISAGFTVDEPNAALGTAIMSPPRTRPARPGSLQRWRRFADRRRGKASLRRRGDAAAKFFPVRWSRNLFLLSARGHEAIMTVHKEAKETKRS
jgi:hypothetical protein